MSYFITITKNKETLYYNQKKVNGSHWYNSKSNSWTKEKTAKNVIKDLKRQKEFLKLPSEVRKTIAVVSENATAIKKAETLKETVEKVSLDLDFPKDIMFSEDIAISEAFVVDVEEAPKKKLVSFPRKSSSFDGEIELLQDAFQLLTLANSRCSTLKNDLSILDRAQQDILHKIELCDLDAVSSTKLFKRLKELRRERRAVKNLIEMYSKFLEVTRGYSPIGSLKGIAELIDNRVYETRALHDLF